jgi:hypothetical protein
MALWVAASLRLDFAIPDDFGTPLLVVSASARRSGAGRSRLGVRTVRGQPRARVVRGDRRGRSHDSRERVGAGCLVLVVPVVDVPRSIPITATLLALTGMFATRFVVRSRATSQRALARTTAGPSSSAPARAGASWCRAWSATPRTASRRSPSSTTTGARAGCASTACECAEPERTLPRSRRATTRRPSSSPCPAHRPRRCETCPPGRASQVSRCSSSPRSASCSAAARRHPTCAPSTSQTCWAASRSTSTCGRSPTSSPASECSSPGPAGRSAPSCAARSAGSARRPW